LVLIHFEKEEQWGKTENISSIYSFSRKRFFFFCSDGNILQLINFIF